MAKKKKLNQTVDCGLALLVLGILSIIFNRVSPNFVSPVYLFVIGPILIIVGLVVLIFGVNKWSTGRSIKSISERIKSVTDRKRESRIEKLIFTYSWQNKGKAFTVRALKTRLDDNFEGKDLYESDLKRILEKLVSLGDLQSNEHDGEIHYFYPTE